jgi:predicted GNAT family acetyltransferase
MHVTRPAHNAPMADVPLTIVHNVDRRRFEASLGDDVAHADYLLRGGVMRMHHTFVPRSFEGRGIAGALVRAALAHARENGLRVAPDCPYVLSYMRRHADTHDLLPAGFDL